MNRHLVIGASGQVGRQLLHKLKESGKEASGTYLQFEQPGLVQLDIRSAEQVASLVSAQRPQYIHLSAAAAHVDRCEADPQEAYRTNVTGVANVVNAANKVGAKLVYFSTDYVFSGRTGPYKEEDPPDPINLYGMQKTIAEHQIGLFAADFLIIRTTVVYGWEPQRKNFICFLIDQLSAGKPLRAPIDQVGNPTYSPNLCEAVIELCEGASGIFNVCGPERVNRYDFARAAATVFGLDENLIQPVKTNELKQTAARPLEAGMYTNKAAARLSTKLLSYREGLQVMRDTPAGSA